MPDHCHSKEALLRMLSQEGGEEALASASEELRRDKEVVLAAVLQNGLSLRFAAESCRDDKEVALQAVLQDGAALEFVSRRLQGDREVVQRALQGPLCNGGKERHLQKPVGMKYLELAGADGEAERCRSLAYASPELLDDRDFMMQVVSQQGDALQYASKSLRQDRELVMAAVEGLPPNSDGSVFQFVDATLKRDKDFVINALRHCCRMYAHIDESLQFDTEIAVRTYFTVPDLIPNTAPAVLQNRDIVTAIVPGLTDKFVVHVALLSGRSCFLFARDQGRVMKVELVRYALKEFGMDESAAEDAELMCGDVPVPPLMIIKRGDFTAKILDLQLILQSTATR